MRVVTAQLAGGERNADRVLVADDAVVVLDGATAFEPVDLDPGSYAEEIGNRILRRLANRAIPDAVHGAVEETARAWGLRPGSSPSSTVSVMRKNANEVEFYVLGDSPICYGSGTVSDVLYDDRIDRVATALRRAYMHNLELGLGFDEQHYVILRQLQREQRAMRNRSDGYWIAEADPEAARNGLLRRAPIEEVQWAVLMTDGVFDVANFVDRNLLWQEIAHTGDAELQRFLEGLHRWERDVDPGGRLLPRAKVHDDKSIAAVSTIRSPAPLEL